MIPEWLNLPLLVLITLVYLILVLVTMNTDAPWLFFLVSGTAFYIVKWVYDNTESGGNDYFI